MAHNTRRVYRNGNRKRKGGERVNNFIVAQNVSHELPMLINRRNTKKRGVPQIVRKTLRHVPKPVQVQYYNAKNVQPQYATYMPYSQPLQITNAPSARQNTVQIVAPIQATQAQVANYVSPKHSIQPMYATREFVQAIPQLTASQVTIKPTLNRSLGTRKLLRKHK